MKNDEDVEVYRKKLEELFSDFYNTKKNVVVSVSFDEKFSLQPIDSTILNDDYDPKAKTSEAYKKIQTISQVKLLGCY